ncbi:GntR family transcriptional regulator [Henriciella sp. AS95]|uniref:GntR family transcriptional regulator n=1 Tax=Henriciella sp. AS95 TaxID=3135782 RepID=UPI00316D15A1
MSRLTPTTLSGAAIDNVRNAILEGELPDGERVNEVHLSETLGVSRTPLREALNRLVSEGLLTFRARHGYYVPPLTLEGFEAEYGIRPILDVAALKLQGLPGAETIDTLKALNRDFLAAPTTTGRIDVDDAFHIELIKDCGNPVLLTMIRQQMVRTRRFEFAYLREQAHTTEAADEHAAIMAALEAGDLDAACAALHANLTSCLDPLRDWLRSRPTPTKG